jgi:hypothetical protein
MKRLGALILGWSGWWAFAAPSAAIDLPNPQSIDAFENNPNAEYSTGDRHFRLDRDSFCRFLGAAVELERSGSADPDSTTDEAQTGGILCEGALVADNGIFFWRVLSETTVEVTNQFGQGVVLFDQKGVSLERWQVPIMEYSKSLRVSRPFICAPWQSFRPEIPVLLPAPEGLIETILNDGHSVSQSSFYSASHERLNQPLDLSDSARRILELSIEKTRRNGERFLPERDIRYLGVLYSKEGGLLFWRILSPTRLMLWDQENRFVMFSVGRTGGK